MKVLLMLGQQDHALFTTVVDMVNRGYSDAAILEQMKASKQAIGNIGGAINLAVQQAGGWPIENPEAPVQPTDPWERFQWRRTTYGRWAAWFLSPPDEQTIIRQKYGDNGVSRMNNFYQSYVRVSGHMGNDGIPVFQKLTPNGEIPTPDLGGAADQYVREMCFAQGREVEPEPSVIGQ